MTLRNVARSGVAMLQAAFRRRVFQVVKSGPLRPRVQPTQATTPPKQKFQPRLVNFTPWDTVAARLRKQAVLNLFPRIGRRYPQTYGPFLAFGLAFAYASEGTSQDDEQRNDLGSYCNKITSALNEFHEAQNAVDHHDYPTVCSGYEMSGRVLAKGSYGAVYLAKVKALQDDVRVPDEDDVRVPDKDAFRENAELDEDAQVCRASPSDEDNDHDVHVPRETKITTLLDDLRDDDVEDFLEDARSGEGAQVCRSSDEDFDFEVISEESRSGITSLRSFLDFAEEETDKDSLGDWDEKDGSAMVWDEEDGSSFEIVDKDFFAGSESTDKDNDNDLHGETAIIAIGPEPSRDHIRNSAEVTSAPGSSVPSSSGPGSSGPGSSVPSSSGPGSSVPSSSGPGSSSLGNSFPDSRAGDTSVPQKLTDMGHFNLVIKMLYNYHARSNYEDIESAFKLEKIPLMKLSGHRSYDTDCPQIPAHPNIVKMFQAFVDENQPPDLKEAWKSFPDALPASLNPTGLGRNKTMYLVMKRYTMTLKQYLKRGPQHPRSAMLLIVQLLEGVAHLNKSCIAHRDLKSDNILVDMPADGGSPSVVIADFGCCFVGCSGSLKMLYHYGKSRGGNPALMAPEVKRARVGDVIDYIKADIWAVGAIAYEILGLENPFSAENKLDSATYKMSDLPPLPSYIDEGFRSVVRSLLEIDPNKRPSASVAANMLHLLLWQPQYWQKYFLVVQCNPSCLSDHLVAWLRLVFHNPNPPNTSNRPITAALPRDSESLVCMSFLARINKDEIIEAARVLLAHHVFSLLHVIEEYFGTPSNCRIHDDHSSIHDDNSSIHDNICCPQALLAF